ncbi:hypothetical protein MAPG_11836 [Magnaporthiopsis poae ATCC 64411]|uniref:Uncharacterized protein n=1 Tax=Magnaporthiopsis poae (strain ATCC 64411 / 73-15) TaxID=644358 RepID=A0A0C4EGA7_MAGP6|nr:hypothetical protein MAPG_11836 [Magnaporthiopsis poae ATCC 64411]
MSRRWWIPLLRRALLRFIAASGNGLATGTFGLLCAGRLATKCHGTVGGSSNISSGATVGQQPSTLSSGTQSTGDQDPTDDFRGPPRVRPPESRRWKRQQQARAALLEHSSVAQYMRG